MMYRFMTLCVWRHFIWNQIAGRKKNKRMWSIYVALLYGYNPMYTPLVCMYSVHTVFILRNTTYLHTHCISPYVFCYWKKVWRRKTELLLIQSHISHFSFATMNCNTDRTFLAEICSKNHYLPNGREENVVKQHN